MKNLKDRIANINTIILLIIASLTFLINYQLSTQQNAREVERFWSEIEGIVESSKEYSGELGTVLANFLISADQFSGQILQTKLLNGMDNPSSEIALLGYEAKFLSEYSALISQIEQVGIKYDFIRLKYHNSAITNELTGWKELFNSQEYVDKWRREQRIKAEDLYLLIMSLKDKSVNDMPSFASKLESKAYILSKSPRFYMSPVLPPTYAFIEKNLEKYKNSL